MTMSPYAVVASQSHQTMRTCRSETLPPSDDSPNPSQDPPPDYSSSTSSLCRSTSQSSCTFTPPTMSSCVTSNDSSSESEDSRSNCSVTINPPTLQQAQGDPSEEPTSVEEENTRKSRWSLVNSFSQSRAAEIGSCALFSLVIDFLPWVGGSYIIYQAFKSGGLGLGFTAFLVLVSAHGLLKWCTAKGEGKSAQELPEVVYKFDYNISV